MAHARAATWSRNVQIFAQGILGDPPSYLASKKFYFYNNKGKADLEYILHQIAEYAYTFPEKKIVNLYVIAHGIYMHTLQGVPVTGPFERCGSTMGGQGILFGTYGLEIADIDIFNILKDKVGKIILYSCGIAGRLLAEPPENASDPVYPACDTSGAKALMIPTVEKAFCKKLCNVTNAFIYASDVRQIYHHRDNSRGRFMDAFKKVDRAVFPEFYEAEFGAWEGQLYEFVPPAGVHRPITRAANDYF